MRPVLTILATLVLAAAVAGFERPASAIPLVKPSTLAAESQVVAVGFGWRRHNYRLHSYDDPHRYEYRQPRYYPYNDSGYWRPQDTVEYHYDFDQPDYQEAWGDNLNIYYEECNCDEAPPYK